MKEIVRLWAMGSLIDEASKDILVNPSSASVLYCMIKFERHGGYEEEHLFSNIYKYHEFPYLFL